MQVNGAAVVADGLVKSFGPKVRALDGVSLEVRSGTVLGLLGPNGAGKTTAVNVLTTLLHPDAGRAEVMGFDVVRNPQAVRRSIGLAGQYAAVDDNLTGLENLTLVARLNHLSGSAPKSRARELLERFGLADAGGRTAKTYSGGMRRRLDLAAALVARPPVLFLDEPTTGLDPRSRIDLWGVIDGLVQEGTTVLLTTQYLEEADRLADRISVVDHGRVIAEGTSAELKGRLGGALVEVRLSDEAQAREVAQTLAGAGDAETTVDGDLVRVPASNGTTVLSEVVRRLDASGVPARRLQMREPSLDDVFLALTGRPAEAAEQQDHDDDVPGGSGPGPGSGSTEADPEPGLAGTTSGSSR